MQILREVERARQRLLRHKKRASDDFSEFGKRVNERSEDMDVTASPVSYAGADQWTATLTFTADSLSFDVPVVLTVDRGDHEEHTVLRTNCRVPLLSEKAHDEIERLATHEAIGLMSASFDAPTMWEQFETAE